MTNGLFQNIVVGMNEAIDRTIGIIDETGTIVACSTPDQIGSSRRLIMDEIMSADGAAKVGGYTYLPFGGPKDEFTVFVEGEDKAAENYAKLASVSMRDVKVLYDEKYDRTTFVKNIMLDNILPSDIYVKSKELNFSTDVHRIVVLFKFFGKFDFVPFDIIQKMFPDKNKDFVISINESDVVLVKEVKPGVSIDEIEAMAKNVADTVSTEFYSRVSVGIGTVVKTLKDVARSYKEAQVSLEVGKVFDTEKNIVSYGNLGIGRLIYQLPTTLCEMFLNEVFQHGSVESLDRETLMTIQCFFDNNLNVSETSRKMFVHRNTLVYRLDKIRKITGLDLRNFDHAITFKVALMVKKYLSSRPVKF